MSSGSGLPPLQHAAFAVISRLLSCLVTERLLRGLYIPFQDDSLAAGVLIILSTHLMSEKPIIDRALHSNDVLVVIPLRSAPVFDDPTERKHGRTVGLLDPLDMLPVVFELVEDRGRKPNVPDGIEIAIQSILVPPPYELGRSTFLKKVEDPIAIWDKFVDGVVINDTLRSAIKMEIQSSFDWQLLAYKNPPLCPSLMAPSIEWEQSLVAGHPTHPMHRARMLPSGGMKYDWYRPRIRFARVHRGSLSILGPFEDHIRSLAMKAASNAGIALAFDASTVIMPVHELQIRNIVKNFEDIEVLDDSIYVLAKAQSSIRTVVMDELPGMSLKVAIGVKISSALRTVSHFTADFGPRFSNEVVPKLTIDRSILSIECEPASAVYRSDDPDKAKHFTAIFREEFQPLAGQTIIVCAALLESDHANLPIGISAVEHAFCLDTREKRLAFLDRYLEMACKALLPPLIYNGVAFEAHAQNVLARFDVSTKELLGFVVRDLGGLRIHPPTLCQSTGLDFKFLPNHCIATETLEETYPKFYHTFVHNHVQRLIRLLGLHTDGSGWELLRKHMLSVIPKDHGLRVAWFSPENNMVPSKCLMRMRMRDSYRDMVYNPIPNMIQFKPETGIIGGLGSSP